MFKDKNIIITGGTSGIGLAIAIAFAKAHANICLIARSNDKLLEASSKLKMFTEQIHLIDADLSESKSLHLVADRVKEKFETIDVLVNNAGIGKFVAFEDMDEECLDLHFDLNVKAPYLLTKNLIQPIIAGKGNIINISSYFSHRMLVGRNSTAYSATKGAVDSFTKSLAFEMGKYGVRVNAVAPGSIETELFNSNLQQLSQEGKDRFEQMVQEIYPMGKIGDVEDVAGAVIFLASDASKWITGSILSVDGGLTTN